MFGRMVVKGIIGAAFLLSVHSANAQVGGPGPKVPAATIAAFLANPGQLLTQFPGAGPELVKQVRDLLNTDKATLASILGLLKLASPDQQIAIADALAQVAKAYAKSDPIFANQIQQGVANAGIPEVSKAYAEAAGDTGTAATGGGGGAGGSQTGNFPTGGQNNGTFTSNNPVTTNGNTINGGNIGGLSTFTTTNTTITNTTTNNNVSTF